LRVKYVYRRQNRQPDEDKCRVHKRTKIFPNATIKSITVITMNAATHKYLYGSFASDIPFVDAVAVVESATPADESFVGNSVLFFAEGCPVGALDTSPALLDDTSSFDTTIAGCSAAAAGFD